jgi:hypothetical protein
MLQRFPLSAYIVPDTVWLSRVLISGTMQERAEAGEVMPNDTRQRIPIDLIKRCVPSMTDALFKRILPWIASNRRQALTHKSVPE